VEIHGDDYHTRDGTCVRDYVHVIICGARSCACARTSGGGARSNQDAAAALLGGSIETARAVTGREIPLRFGPRRSGDPAVLIASSEKIRRELGWDPQFQQLEAMIGSAWAWMQAHPRGYDSTGD
jgi:UDP-glucose 4-epimerase